MKYKNFLIYLLFLLPWFLSAILFKVDTNYYNSLVKPFFAPPPIVFAIVWPILYILIAYSIYKVWKDSDSNYKIYLFINYLSNQLYTFCFFMLKNNFLALTDTIIVLLSSLYLYMETNDINKTYSKFLIPYIIWDAFALLLSISFFILN